MRETATLLFTFICLAWLSAASGAAVELYVAPNGNDAWSGRKPAPIRNGSDGPFATLERARDALRALRASGKARGPATVWLRGGLYERASSFALEAEDGGAPGAPVEYRAVRGEEVRLSGGRTVGGWKPVTDAAVLARIPEEARPLVRVADLRAQGITDTGAMARRGFAAGGAACLELVYADTPMTPARWPNEGWATIAAAPAGPDGGRFAYTGDRPSRWTSAEEAWVHGYWMYDWADTYEKVASIDPAKREIATVPPHGVYGYGPGRRWYVLNLIEELDAPGEYWLDRAAGLLYCIPPAGKSGPAVVTMAAEPLVTLKGARNVTLAGLILENGRGDGLHMKDCTDCVVAGCTLRNMGGSGMSVEGGSRCGARSCDIYGVGETGVQLSGGDRMTLTPSGHFAENCHIHHHSRWCRTYRPAIGMQGVGVRASHNLIEDGPHNAILLGGNDHVIEFNDISRVCTQTGDAGAVYMGRDWAMRGVVVRHNRFHDIGPTISAGQEGRYTEVMAVYLDDCFSGGTIAGNLFLRAGRAIMLGGGRDNTVENNVFIDCNPSVHIDQRAKGWAAEYMKPNGGWSIFENLKAVPYNRPPYDKYPHLAAILEDDPPAAKYNRIVRNIHVGKGKWIDWLDGLNDKVVEATGNATEGDPGFLNAAAGDYRLKPGSPALKAGFQPTLFHKAGLYRDAYRKTPAVRYGSSARSNIKASVRTRHQEEPRVADVQSVCKAFEQWYATLPVLGDGLVAKGNIAGCLGLIQNIRDGASLSLDDHLTPNKGQVRGVGGPNVRRILAHYGEARPFVAEGGRTNRGLIATAQALLGTLEEAGLDGLSADGRDAALVAMQEFLVARVREYFGLQRLRVTYDGGKSTAECIRDLLSAAREHGKEGQVAEYLVGAKLQLRFPGLTVRNTSYSTSDAQTQARGDFEVGTTAFHVTVAPNSGHYAKCRANVRDGLRVYLLVPERMVEGARQNAAIEIPGVIAAVALEAFIGCNVDELAEFSGPATARQLGKMLRLYNERVAAVETDTSVLLDIPATLE